MAQERPVGITVVAIIAGILGILALLGGALVFVGGALIGSFAGSSEMNVGFAGGLIGGLFGVIGLVLIALGIADLAFTYGVWTLKPWAWMLGIVIAAVSIVLALLSIGSNSNLTQIVTIGLWAVVLYYLNTPLVKTALGRP
jgi:hypothetical protein